MVEAPVGERQVKMLIQELVRNALAQMLVRQEAAFDPAESAAHTLKLDEQRAHVMAAQRARDWSLAKELGAASASRVGLHPNALVHPARARELLAQSRALIELSLEVECDGVNPLVAARDILQEVGLKPEREALRPPMQLSAAIEKACEDAPVEVEKKIRAVGVLANAYFGDVTMAGLTSDQVCDFLKFVWNMPKNWGQLHGKNRFEQVGSGLTPHQIKDAADAADKALIEEVIADSTRSVPEKRLHLVQELQPRLADGYLYTQRDMFNRIYRAAMGAAATSRRVSDANTDETIIAARVEGASTPHDDEAKTFEIVAARMIADRLLRLQQSHSLTLPASEVALAAFEHLLILRVPPAPTAGLATRKPASTDTCTATEAAPSCTAPATTIIRWLRMLQLVVGVKVMNGKRYLDVAIGAPAQPDAVVPHQIVVADDAGLASARIPMATCFDLRRRILVAADDRAHFHRRLGTLEGTSKRRLREAMSFLGDVSP